MILVEIINTFLVNMGKEFVILLRGKGDERTLPISIGQLEAQSIAIQLNQIPFPRPLTHDLFKSVLNNIDCKVLRIEICDLIDDTFYARLVLENNGKKIEIDSRPSDAIALALRFAVPIYVEDKIMIDAGIILPEDTAIEALSGITAESGTEKVAPKDDDDSKNEVDSELTPLEALQKQLKIAIKEEDYEGAARIRDEINNVAKSN
jgi:bifunctional DNase/RNase